MFSSVPAGACRRMWGGFWPRSERGTPTVAHIPLQRTESCGLTSPQGAQGVRPSCASKRKGWVLMKGRAASAPVPSEPQYPHLKNGENNSSYCTGSGIVSVRLAPGL